MPQLRMPKEEIVRRGKEWYERDIRARVEPGNRGKVVAINIENGEYEMDEDNLAAVHRARAKQPNALLFAVRVGFPAFSMIRTPFMHPPMQLPI